MTPPPNAEVPWRSAPCYVPPPPDSLSISDDPSSLDLLFDRRPMDPSLDPSFVDVVDALDAMMAPPPVRVATGRAKWNNYKAATASGYHICNWILEHGFSKSRSNASEFARLLVKHAGLIPTFKVESPRKTFNALPTSSYVHRGLTLLHEHGLNSAAPYPANPRDVLAVLSDLNTAFKHVCHVSVSLDGHFVDYDQVRGSPGWRKALVLLSELAVCDDAPMATADPDIKKACLYNLYNLLIFHAKLVFGHPTDLIKRSKFFNDAAYVVAGKRITSVELEHDILRTRLSPSDPRAHWKLPRKDPRMHFILNCGAQSCPPLVPIEPDHTEKTLQAATHRFIEKNCDVDIPGKKVTLSRLFKWFRTDFTPTADTDRALLHWISQRATKDTSLLLADLMASDFKVKFAAYNWADNGDVNAKPDVRFMAIYDISFSKTA